MFIHAYICACTLCVCVYIHTCLLRTALPHFELFQLNQQSFELTVVNLSTRKSCMNQLNLWAFTFISQCQHHRYSALFSMMPSSVLQHPCRSSQLPSGMPYRAVRSGGPTRTLKEHCHQQCKHGQYNPISVIITGISRSQVINLVSLVCPTTPICYVFGHF